MNPNQPIRNKNPLLSCAVTGGFEEFTGSGIVLAAAEKPVFTIGTPAISDTEFSDVSLDRDVTSDALSAPAEAPGYYSPLAELDSMGNLQNIQSAPTLDLSQDQQQQPVDTNLNPISAALAQLPNAASTVFSTFSSIIKGSSSHLKMDEQYHQQQMAAPPLMEPSHQENVMNPSGFMVSSGYDPNAPPPAFFSPNDDLLFKKQSAEPALNNTFRLGGSKKKTYAHIPGLSSHQQQMPSVAQNFNVNPVMPPLPPHPEPPVNTFQAPSVDYFQAPQVTNNYVNQPQTKEPEKTNKFSLTSLLPSQLIETATKNFFGSTEPSLNYDQPNYDNRQDFNVMTTTTYGQPQSVNFFDGQQQQQQASPFVGVIQPEPQHIQQQIAPPPASFFTPQQFNTEPFGQNSAEQSKERKDSVGINHFQPEPPMATQPQVSVFNQTTFAPPPFSKAFNQPAAPQVNEPPQAVAADANCPPPTFFNPMQASEMFRANQNDDGKPKNPYSSRVIRGVGMYKTRGTSESSNTQPVVMPSMPDSISFSNSVASQFAPGPQLQFTSTPSSVASPMMSPISNVSSTSSLNAAAQFPPMFEQKIPSRPASIPPSAVVLLPPLPNSNNFFNQGPPQFMPSVQQQMFAPPAAMPCLPPTFVQTLDSSRPSSILSQSTQQQLLFDPSQQFAPQLQSGFPSTAHEMPLIAPSMPDAGNSANFVQQPPPTMFEPQKVPSRPPSIPPQLSVTNFMPHTQQDFLPVQELQKTPSRPPSIPPAGNCGFANQQEVNQTNPAVLFPSESSQQVQAPASLFFDPSRSFDQSITNGNYAPVQPGRKKSDLNVPEPPDDVTAAVNFFESPQVASHFENLPPSSATANSLVANFFQRGASESEFSHRDNMSTMSNFFGSEADSAVTSVSHSKRDSLSNQTIPTSNADTTNDISDKLDSLSMSDNIGSQLSLFATSELDASLVQKKPVAFDSMIPKYLDTQIDAAARTTPSPAPSLSKTFRPVYRHWFYQNLYWHPFSMSDSLALDEAITSGKETVVTDGGRFEVNLKEGRRSSIYWLSGSNVIRRCSWFFKNSDNVDANLIPFDEQTANYLESEYEKAFSNNSWNHQLRLPNTGELIVYKDATNLEYHQMGQVSVVKRGVDEFDIEDGEEAPVDHLIISVSGFGDKVGDSADELRAKCMETIQHYYSEAFDCGQVGRLEVLPISLNSVDVLKMKDTNSTIEAAPAGNAELMKSSEYQDIIMKTAFYCNQDFYQNIMNHLAFSLNEIVTKFMQRNAEFKGEFSLIATSFEALFLFDLLLNQETASDFWTLKFSPANFYAFGMPSNLLTIRNGPRLQTNFEIKNCKKFLNVVHRLDPVAQRIEPLIRPELTKMSPESIESEATGRTDYTIADGSSLESFSLKNYFTSELVILRITNEIYGALKMDSGSL